MKIEDIAKHYIAAPAYEPPLEVTKAFRQFVIDVAQVELQGINFQYVDFDPYFRGSQLCIEDMYADVNQGNLMISTQGKNSDLYYNLNLLDPEVDLIFRCIHEMHHLKLKAGFGWEGEFLTAAHAMSFTDKPLFKQMLFSETVAQVAMYIQTGQFPKDQKVVLFEREFVRRFEKYWPESGPT